MPSFRDILNTLSIAAGTYNKVTFMNTSNSMAWIHLVIFLKDRAIDILMLSLCVKGDKGKGLIRWVISSSFGDGEGICDITLWRLTREFLTDISGRG